MKVIKNASGYFVTNRGFAGRSQSEATKFEDGEVANTLECIASCGLTGPFTTEDVVADSNVKQNADGTSYAVCFVRPKQIRSDLSINTHRLNPSPRRFATWDEASHHARRFVKIEKHAGAFIVLRREPVNAYVNKVTGKTNPEIGKARTNRE